MAGQQDASEPTRRIDQQAARELFERGDATFVDVRSAEAYERSHIPGALSLPLHQLSRRLGEVSEDRSVVTYCA